jgi:hypothetical protein
MDAPSPRLGQIGHFERYLIVIKILVNGLASVIQQA